MSPCRLDHFDPVSLSFLNLLFCIGVFPVNNAVIVPGEQRRDSAIHIHISTLPQTPLPSRLPHNIEQLPVLNSRSLLVIHLKYNSEYMCIPGIEPRRSALGAWRLSHWTTREIPEHFLDKKLLKKKKEEEEEEEN